VFRARRPLVKGLGVDIMTTLVQVNASPAEQSRTLGNFEAPLADKLRAGLRLWEKPLAEGPCRNSTSGNERFTVRTARSAHSRFVHRLLQHRLHQAVDLKGSSARSRRSREYLKNGLRSGRFVNADLGLTGGAPA
jgi:hypothetical protein